MNFKIKRISELRKYIADNKKKVVIWGAGFLGINWAYEFLIKNEIHTAYYCDNNNELWNATINNCKVISLDKLKSIAKEVFVFVTIRKDQTVFVVEQLREYGIVDVMEYTDLLHLQGVKEQYFPFMKERSIAVYTCVTGGYDEILEHDCISELCDYYIITDNPDNYTGSYFCLDIKDYIPSHITDTTRQNRYCKINAHKIFPQYRFSIYYDANTIFTKDFTYMIEKLTKTRLAVASSLFEDSLYGDA